MESSKLVGLMDVMTEYANQAIRVLPTLGIALLVLALTYVASKIAKSSVRKLSSTVVEDPSIQSLLGTLTSVAVLAIGLFAASAIVFPGLEAGDLVAVVGLSGVAIGFAFKDIFENFLAGILILSRRPFSVGDQIEVDGLEGRVEDITFRDSEIKTYDGQKIVVPNSHLFKNPVTVRTAFETRRTTFETGVGYDEDIDEAMEIIQSAVEECENVLEEPEPRVLCWEHGDSSVNFSVRFWTKSEQSYTTSARAEVARSVKYGLDAAGIEIPYPYRTVEFFDMTKALENEDSAEDSAEAAAQ